MEGLNEILLKIEQDNKLVLKEIADNGNAEAQGYIDDTVKSANLEADEIIKSAEKKSKQLLENAANGCESLIKKQELSARAEVISDFIDYAVNKIKSMDDEGYFNIITKLIYKNAQKGEGLLLMSQKDIDRMPEDYIKNINSELKKNDASLILCDVPVNTDGGFIIVYGGIEENCTFDALLEDKMDYIKDKLFEQLKA